MSQLQLQISNKLPLSFVDILWKAMFKCLIHLMTFTIRGAKSWEQLPGQQFLYIINWQGKVQSTLYSAHNFLSDGYVILLEVTENREEVRDMKSEFRSDFCRVT